MSATDDTDDKVKPPDFNSIFTSEEPSALDEEWAAAVNGAQERQKDAPPTWHEIKKQRWNEIETKYKQGDRTKQVVCAWMTYKAALVACKGWPQGSFDKILSAGYEAAISRWPDYDPAKDKGNGTSGLLYTAAFGRMRNAAHELLTSHGKRKHRATDVIPNVVVSQHSEYFASKAHGHSDDADNWMTQVSAPSDRLAGRLARIAAETYVHRLLALLPRDDRELIILAWGLDGEEATPEELAERSGCSVATVYRRINKLLAELKAIACRKRPAKARGA